MGRRQGQEFIRRVAGLNTRLDPESIQVGTRTNGYVAELSRAVNIDINDAGQASLRNGSTPVSLGNYHSLFCKGGPCLVVQEREADAAIMQLVSVDPVSLVGVRSGLTKNLRMAWDQSAEDVFYSNGLQSGYIRGGVSAPWPLNTYQGAEADLQFATSVPVASHLSFMQGGQVLISVGRAIFSNHDPFKYGLFELSAGNVAAFESPVTMIVAVRDGFFASDGVRTWFFRKMSWYRFKQELVETAPAFEWSLAHDTITLRDIGIDASGIARVWASRYGVCIGTDDGTFVNLTKEKVKYPAGYAYAASLVKDYTVINTAW